MLRRWWLLVVLSSAACDSASSLPLEAEVKEKVEPAGAFAELRVVVRSLPGAEVGVDEQSKSMDAARATEQFSIPKSRLKLGKNTFVARARTVALLSKKEAEKTVTWEGRPPAFLRFHGSPKGTAEALACVGPMCEGAALKAAASGRVPVEVESAIPATLTLAGTKVALTPGQRAPLEIDLLPLLAARPADEVPRLAVPLSFEANGEKADEVLELESYALSDLTARVLAEAERAPVIFPGEPGEARGRRKLLLVVGAPVRKIIRVGSEGTFADVDLVGIARKAERAFACSGESEITYNDLEIRVVERRSSKPVATKKLLADRVACPQGAAGKLTGDVREDDIKRVLGELVTR